MLQHERILSIELSLVLIPRSFVSYTQIIRFIKMHCFIINKFNLKMSNFFVLIILSLSMHNSIQQWCATAQLIDYIRKQFRRYHLYHALLFNTFRSDWRVDYYRCERYRRLWPIKETPQLEYVYPKILIHQGTCQTFIAKEHKHGHFVERTEVSPQTEVHLLPCTLERELEL